MDKHVHELWSVGRGKEMLIHSQIKTMVLLKFWIGKAILCQTLLSIRLLVHTELQSIYVGKGGPFFQNGYDKGAFFKTTIFQLLNWSHMWRHLLPGGK